MERIMNEENDLDHNVGDVVEGPNVCVSTEVLQALNEMKTGKGMKMERQTRENMEEAWLV